MKITRPKHIYPGLKCYYRAKIGGERQLINVVVASESYKKDIGKERCADYVKAFGWGWSGEVQVKKLMIVEVCNE